MFKMEYHTIHYRRLQKSLLLQRFNKLGARKRMAYRYVSWWSRYFQSNSKNVRYWRDKTINNLLATHNGWLFYSFGCLSQSSIWILLWQLLRYFKYVLENIHCESVDSLLPYSLGIKKKYSNDPIPPSVIWRINAKN